MTGNGDLIPRASWTMIVACLAIAFTSGGVVLELNTLSADVREIKVVIGGAASNTMQITALESLIQRQRIDMDAMARNIQRLETGSASHDATDKATKDRVDEMWRFLQPPMKRSEIMPFNPLSSASSP